MGSGSSKSRASSARSGHDSDEEKPVKNWEGEIIGWIPLSDSEKLRRRQMKQPAPRISRQSSGSGSDSDDNRSNNRFNSIFGRKSSSNSSRSNNSRFRRNSSAKSDSGKSEYSRRSNSGKSDTRFGRYSRNQSKQSLRRRSTSRNRNSSEESDARSRGSFRRRRDSKSSEENYPPSLRRPSIQTNASSDSDIDRAVAEYSRLSRKSSWRSSGDNRSTQRSRSRSRNSMKSNRSSKIARYKPIGRYPAPRPTLVAKPRFSRETQIALLHSAVEGLGTNEKQIIDVMGSMNSAQRQDVKRGYMARYRKDLIEVLRDELSGHFEDLCVALATDDLIFDTHTVQLFLERDSRHVSLIGLLAKTSPTALKLIRKKYKTDYEEDLLQKIEKRCGDDFAEVIKNIFNDKRHSSKRLDYDAVQKDTEDLIESYQNEENDVFKMMLFHLIGNRSADHIREICEAFRQLEEDDELTKVIEKKLGHKGALPINAYVEACEDSAVFFAGSLKTSFKGAGTDELLLIRIIVSRSEIDLMDVAEAYEEVYNKPLKEEIKSETSGDFQRMLLKLIEGNVTYTEKSSKSNGRKSNSASGDEKYRSPRR